jgi:predicted dehydrogenase
MVIRIGVLGAARIAPPAIIRPARAIDGVQVTAIAARDRTRADAFAQKQGVPRVFDSYQELIDDPDIDAIYNPLPNGLHGYWTLKAIDAGKHVLCEKPFAANMNEATAVTERIEAQDKIVMEAFHYRYHPVMKRVEEILANGELGEIQTVSTSLCIPLPMHNDIRYHEYLAGGAAMDIGCYATNLWRVLSQSEPTVTSATAKTIRPNVDRAMHATLTSPLGATGTLDASLLSSKLFKLSGKANGSLGSLSLFNPLGPQFYHRLKITTKRSSRIERFDRVPTYNYQLEAFRDAITIGTPFPTTPRDSINTMRIIDAMYVAAGMTPRQPTLVDED